MNRSLLELETLELYVSLTDFKKSDKEIRFRKVRKLIVRIKHEHVTDIEEFALPIAFDELEDLQFLSPWSSSSRRFRMDLIKFAFPNNLKTLRLGCSLLNIYSSVCRGVHLTNYDLINIANCWPNLVNISLSFGGFSVDNLIDFIKKLNRLKIVYIPLYDKFQDKRNSIEQITELKCKLGKEWKIIIRSEGAIISRI